MSSRLADLLNKSARLQAIMTYVATGAGDPDSRIAEQEFYHLGASIKDVGHRGFMFSRIEEQFVIDALRNEWSKEWAAAVVVI